MIPTRKVIKQQLKGDTFNGVRFTLSPATDLTGASIKTQFRKASKKGDVEKEVSIGSGITVESASDGIFVWDAFIMDFPVATYYYDVEITFSDGKVKTYVEGIIEVIQDTSF